MGMDIYGKNPDSEVGEYLRHSVWSWHPLAEYAQSVAPTIVGKIKHLHSNDGDGLNGAQSVALAMVLKAEVSSGKTEQYVQARKAALEALPDVPCDICKGTGIRTDAVGVQHGQPERETTLPDGTKRKGWCNGCSGKGSVRPWPTHYGFGTGDVEEFAEFLEHCGGFKIN